MEIAVDDLDLGFLRLERRLELHVYGRLSSASIYALRRYSDRPQGLSLRLEIRLLRDLRPFVELLGEPGVQLTRRHALRVDPERSRPLRELGRIDDRADIAREPRQH